MAKGKWNGDAKWKAGILSDLLGHFDDAKVKAELNEFIQLPDNKLKLFAAISLLKLHQEVDPKVLQGIAADLETREWLYKNLLTIHKEDLFPTQYKTQEAFAESDMVNWLLYPTELGRKPDAIELMKVVTVDSKSEHGMVEFYLFRFKSDHKDWKNKGWMAGVSGYYPVKDKPSSEAHGYTFSGFESWDAKTPDQHVEEIRTLLDESYEQHQ